MKKENSFDRKVKDFFTSKTFIGITLIIMIICVCTCTPIITFVSGIKVTNGTWTPNPNTTEYIPQAPWETHTPRP